MPDGHSPIVEAKPSIYAALARAQAKMGAALKDSTNPHFNSDFASLSAVREAINGPLTDEGIAYVQLPFNGPDGEVGVRTILAHGPSGDTVQCEVMLGLGSTRNAAQDAGKMITYLRRYSLMSITGIAPADDDDGNSLTATRPAAKKKSAAQAKRDGDFEKFQGKVAEKGAAEGADGIRAWIKSDAMQKWLDQFSRAFADGMRDEAEAQAKALEAKQNKSGRRRQPTDQPYSKTAGFQKVMDEFEEFCEVCTVPSEILSQADAVKAFTDVIQEQDEVDDVADRRIEQLEKEAA